MASTHIVIVTNFFDVHVDILIRTLVGMGHNPVRVNSQDLPMNASISVSNVGGGWEGSLCIRGNGRRVRWREVTAVWWRKPTQFEFPSDLSERERDFAEEELEHVTRGLWASLDCYWMSRPENIKRASYKIEQLRRAAELGFTVPSTIVTSEPDAVRAFFHDHRGRIVYKVLTDPFLAASASARRISSAEPESVIVSTTPIGEDQLASDLDSLQVVPCMFQEYIEKRIEYRVTVIGDDVFVASINSQSEHAARVDWRAGVDQLGMFAAAKLPDAVVGRCVAMVQSYGLEFGAIDLIETPDGDHVFLEINPNGQFLFIEDRVPQLRLTDALAARLIRGVRVS